MKKIFLLALTVAALSACNTKTAPPAVDTAKEEQAIMDADKDFCAIEQKDGMSKGMEKYYDDNVITITTGQPVGNSKAAALKLMTDVHMDTAKNLIWTAEKAFVSASGDLGYVWGHYHYSYTNKAGVDTTGYGAYCTIYRKAADGSWKAVVDQNNETPKP